MVVHKFGVVEQVDKQSVIIDEAAGDIGVREALNSHGPVI
jgi:hypothetical protein